MTRWVVFAPEAETDLTDRYVYISDRSGVERAFDYAERIVTFCERLSDFPERGQCRDDLRPGLRVVGFERRVAIAFHITSDMVAIDRILYGGRDLPAVFLEDRG